MVAVRKACWVLFSPRKAKGPPWLEVTIMGNIFVAMGAIGVALDLIFKSRFSYGVSSEMVDILNLGIVLGYGAITIAGLVALTVARSVKSLDERLRNAEHVLNRQ